MRGLTIKLPEATLRRLRDQARATGRSMASVVRDCLETSGGEPSSVHDRAADLAGSLAGRRQAATNTRRRIRRR